MSRDSIGRVGGKSGVWAENITPWKGKRRIEVNSLVVQSAERPLSLDNA